MQIQKFKKFTIYLKIVDFLIIFSNRQFFPEITNPEKGKSKKI
jgi:hypothetical protein